MDRKKGKAVREKVYEALAGFGAEGVEYVGRGTEGNIYDVGDGDNIVIRVIAKSEDFDAQGAVNEYDKKQKVAEEKAKQSKAKATKDKKKRADVVEQKVKATIEKLEKIGK